MENGSALKMRGGPVASMHLVVHAKGRTVEHMNKTLKRMAVLAGVFVAAAGIYFISSLNRIDQTEAVYTDMEEPSLPVVCGSLPGGEENRLPGYRREMEPSVTRDSLLVLPQDRQLTVTVEEHGSAPLGISYEIRTMDQERLVERTEVERWESLDGESVVTLPIQNLITQGNEYLLHMMMETENHGILHYYSRILWPDNDYAQSMLAFARDFSQKTLTGEGAETLVTYLETSDSADNSSLGHVTIKSSFSQLTWAGLRMELDGAMEVTMKELDGIMGQVQVSYRVRRQSETGTEELYDVEDHYTLKWNEKRLYLMDFDRRTNQIFAGSRDLYSGKRILLGIGNDDVIQLQKSPDKRYISFVFNRDLWRYDQKEKEASKIFSFRSSLDASGRSDYDRHDVKILSVKNSGDVDFLVYGYMNRGKHEGDNGISLFHYRNNGTIAERFFVPSSESFGEIQEDLDTLVYLSGQDMLYLYRNDAVFGIDLSSNEYMVVTDGLTEGCFSISGSGRLMAWQETQQPEGSDRIHIIDFETGVKQEIAAPKESTIRTLGFVQEDFVYGLVRQGDVWMLNDRAEEYPMYADEIVVLYLVSQPRYEKPGSYVSHVEVEAARVHMDRLTYLGNQEYARKDSDTIVCNAASEEAYLEGIGWFASEVRRKVYFVQPDQEIANSRDVRVTVAKRITYDETEELNLQPERAKQGKSYYAYGRGEFLGTYARFSQAVEAAYEVMGFVTNKDQQILWNRVNRQNIRNIRNPQTEAYEIIRYLEDPAGEAEGNLELIDARGCTMSQMLYFIDKGVPVASFTEGGNYVLLCGFDQYNVTVYDPAVGDTYKMGLNDGAAYFAGCRNDFVCGIRRN